MIVWNRAGNGCANVGIFRLSLSQLFILLDASFIAILVRAGVQATLHTLGCICSFAETTAGALALFRLVTDE
jgi:hypothetical protein